MHKTSTESVLSIIQIDKNSIILSGNFQQYKTIKRSYNNNSIQYFKI